jgi:colicin import membrane protein
MQANSPNAFFLSTFLHACVVALIFLFSYLTSDSDKKPPKIFELVAGEGDNYMATEAPALGEPGGVKMPPIPVAPVIKSAPEPEPQPEPVTRAPEPVIQRAPEPKPAPTKKLAPDEIRDFSKDVKRISQKRQARLEAVEKKKREAEERKAKEEALKNKRLTKEEYDRLNKGAKSPTGSASQKVARIDSEGIRRGVVGGSTANKEGGAGGKAMSREQADALDLYFSLLKQRLKEALDKPPGLSDSLVAIVEVYIGADGRLGNPKIKRSSGSQEFDQAAMEAVARVRSIGAKPDGKGEVLNIPFRMREDDED